MKDLNALSLIESQKEKYTSLTEKLKSGEDLLLYNEDVQFTTDRLCTDIQRYINAIQDEIQALNEMIKSFTIHLGEKMKQLVESKYFEGIPYLFKLKRSLNMKKELHLLLLWGQTGDKIASSQCKFYLHWFMKDNFLSNREFKVISSNRYKHKI